jgi:glutamate-1-semialdehyde 2,1-aminomutase
MARFSPVNDKIFQEASGFVPGGVMSSARKIVPHLVFREARGAQLVDADGCRYLDYHAAFGSVLLGHNHPLVNRRVREALEAAAPLAGAGATELEVEVARKIHLHVPCAEKVLLCNSGSEAVLHAVRVARAFTRRNKIIKFRGCYHGVHDSVLRDGLSPAARAGKVDPGSAGILPEVMENTLVCEFNDLDAVERTLAAHGDCVAAIIVEPVAHNMGCVLPRPGFLQGLRELSRARGSLLIFDEVITGFRHHLGGYQAICGIKPDLATLGKAIANGFPLAAVCGRAEIMNHFNTRDGGDTYFAGTFNGNAVGCAAALATIDILEREPVHQHVFRLGERLRQGLREIHTRLSTGASVAGFGSVFLTYFAPCPIENYSDALRNDSAMFVEYRRGLLERGIFKMPVNLKRAHVGYSHTDEDAERLLEAAEEVLKSSHRVIG